jgi:hypothetical protein
MELSELIAAYPAERRVFWVGAGVSYPGPSALPLGIPLTDFALQQCCGDAIRQRLRQVWDEANKIVAQPGNDKPLGIAPRLESVLGDIDDVGKQSRDCEFDFLRGFESFLEAPYNENHLCLARLYASRATVITTNFDICIETACGRLPIVGDVLEAGREFGVHFYGGKPAGARIWHIHGTAESLQTLGATIRAVQEGLPEAFCGWLDGVLERGCLLVFLGYSASDSFDVNLYFSDKAAGAFPNSTGLFIQHAGGDVPPNAGLLLRPFGRSRIEVADTSEWLRGLSGGEVECGGRAPFEWKDVFLRRAALVGRERVRDFLICKLAFTLGLNIDILDEAAYEGALRSEAYFDALDFHKTLAYVCRVQDKGNLEKRHDLKVKRDDSDLLGYYYSKGDSRRALRHARPIVELHADAIRGVGELNWRTYTSMSAHCRPLVMKYLKNPFAGGVTNDDRGRLEEMIELTAALGNMPLRNVRFINQVATALRFNFMFEALLLGAPSEETFRRVMSLYGDSASLAGFIGAYRDASVRDFFLFKYHHRGHLGNALAQVEVSLRLATLVGDVPGAKRARKLKTLYKVHSWLTPVVRVLSSG